MLDAVGDLYMSGHSILGSFKAYKTGHKLNNMLLRAVLENSANYEFIEAGESAEQQAINFLDSPEQQAGFGHKLILG